MANSGTLAQHHEAAPEHVRQRQTVAPLLDVYENDDGLLLVADVPGARQDSVDVELEAGELTIRAQRAEEPAGTPLAAEHRPSDYVRTFAVPQGIDGARIEAQLSAGVLRVVLPRAASLKPRRIAVRGG